MALIYPSKTSITYIVPGEPVTTVYPIGSLVYQMSRELAAEFIFEMWEEGGHVWIPVPLNIELEGGFKLVCLERVK